MRSACKDMADSAVFWGCARVYTFGMAAAATDWNGVSGKKKAKAEKKLSAMANRIRARCGNVSPALKTRLLFTVMRAAQKNGWNPADVQYWKEQGWLGNKRPWKD